MRKYLLAAAAAAAIATSAQRGTIADISGSKQGPVFPTHSSVHVDATNSYYCTGGDGEYYFGSYFSTCKGSVPDALQDRLSMSTSSAVTTSACSGSRASSATSAQTTSRYSLSGGYRQHQVRRAAPQAWSAMVNGLVDFGDDKSAQFLARRRHRLCAHALSLQHR